jgi:hypothetical protein
MIRLRHDKLATECGVDQLVGMGVNKAVVG